MIKNKDYKKEFSTCPVCGSDQRFCEQLGEEAKFLGQASPNFKFYYDHRQGVVLDQKQVNTLLVGTKVPAFAIATDICLECGTLYAVSLTRGEGQLRPQPGAVPPPKFSAS